jgi:hypothetical protein
VCVCERDTGRTLNDVRGERWEVTLDQACAYGPGKPVLLTFDGDALTVEPVHDVGVDVHLVVADLDAAKDTVTILRDLQIAYPTPTCAIHEGVHKLLGEMNQSFVSAAVRAIAEVGGCTSTSGIQLTHSLKAPGFKP